MDELTARQQANRRYHQKVMADPVKAAARRERHRAWRKAHPEFQRQYHARRRTDPAAVEVMREQSRRFNEAHREERRAALRAYEAANKERVRARRAAWFAAHPGARHAWRDRRRAAEAGIALVVKVASDECGVCLQPLTSEPYPHPMSTTIGHEPPISRAAKEGWLIVTQRPEHWACNSRKAAKLDCEVAA